MRKFIKFLFSTFGLTVQKADYAPRVSMGGILRHLKKLGLNPATVIDVGAAFGDWTRLAHHVFPQARYILIEPLHEYEKSLDELQRGIPNSKIFFKAAGKDSGAKIILNVHKDLVGSSLFEEVEDAETLVSEKRKVSCVALDDFADQSSAPLFIKIDAQGAELDVLNGARKIMQQAEVIILEASFFSALKNAPVFADVISFMKENDFVIYDIAGFNYRPLDGALAQIDAVFVKENSKLRENHAYATRQQRFRQNEKFIRKFRNRLLNK